MTESTSKEAAVVVSHETVTPFWQSPAPDPAFGPTVNGQAACQKCGRGWLDSVAGPTRIVVFTTDGAAVHQECSPT